MKLIFIDEFNGVVNTKLYGLSLLCIDISKYNKIATSFAKSLTKNGWAQTEEFKGRYLFSNNPAGQTKTPVEMIALTKEIIGWLSSQKNTRALVYYAHCSDGKSVKNFCSLVEKIISHIPKAQGKNNGKHLTSVYYDIFDECTKPANLDAINNSLNKSLALRGYHMVEASGTPVNSSNKSVGVIYADVCTTLCRWIVENPKQQKQINLLDLIEDGTKNKKVQVIYDISALIKQITLAK